MAKKEPIEVRLWRRVTKTDSCWLWQGYKNWQGYGRIGNSVDGRQTLWLVHRLSYTLLVGPIPEGLQLDHLCRVTNCVNPDHLEPVTNGENGRRGYASRGKKTHCKRGHEFTPANTMPQKKVYRRCRTCHNKNVRDSKARSRLV